MLASLFVVGVLFVLIAPGAYAVLTSLQPRRVALQPEPTYAFRPTLENFRSLFSEYDFLPYFINSVVSSIGATLIALVIGVPAAYAMSRGNFRGFWGLVAGLMCCRALPAIGVAIPAFIIFTEIRLIDTTLGLMVVYLPFCVALVAWLMHNFFESVPRSLDEAASIDGCGRLATLVRVILPVSTPGLVGTAVFAFLFGWNNFLYPLVLTQRRATTVPVALTEFIGAYTINWGQIMAGVVVLSAPMIVIAMLVRRYMVAGLSLGAVRE